MRYSMFLVLGATLAVCLSTFGKRLFFRTIVFALSQGDGR